MPLVLQELIGRFAAQDFPVKCACDIIFYSVFETGEVPLTDIVPSWDKLSRANYLMN